MTLHMREVEKLLAWYKRNYPKPDVEQIDSTEENNTQLVAVEQVAIEL